MEDFIVAPSVLLFAQELSDGTRGPKENSEVESSAKTDKTFRSRFVLKTLV